MLMSIFALFCSRCYESSWVCEMASDFQKCLFTGVSMIDCFPSTKPFNVASVRGDVLNRLEFEDNTFDFIFIRGGILDYTLDHWENFVIPEAIRVLKPRGYIEVRTKFQKALM